MNSAVRRDTSVPYYNMRDEDVVAFARCGNQKAAEYLVRKYRYLVENKARNYFMAGADHDDVVQEGMIGLCKAIRDFRGDRLSRFRAFADLCVTRQIITAVKSATRQKHGPLNGYVSIYCGSETDTEGSLLECIADEHARDPAAWYMELRERRRLRECIHHTLSELESQVLECYLSGKSYEQMSEELACRPKSIDNALQRVKRKIERVLDEPR